MSDAIYDLTLAEAAKVFPGRPSANAVWRWCVDGVKLSSGERLYLESGRGKGRRLYTSRQAIKRFMEIDMADRRARQEANRERRAMPPRVRTRPRTRTRAQREQDQARAAAALDKAGI